VALGAYIDGIPVVNRQLTRGSLDWLTPFTLFCGAGAGRRLRLAWLHLADHEDRRRVAEGRCMILARPLALVLLVVMGIVSLWTPLAHQEIAAPLV
jgi:cytochrome d ubiquinol oxidase subunit II